MSDLVAPADLTSPCDCGAPLCQMSMDEAVAHLDGIVRREIANELDRLAAKWTAQIESCDWEDRLDTGEPCESCSGLIQARVDVRARADELRKGVGA